MMAGCASGTGAKWYAPATWFSHVPADALDRAERKEDNARAAVIKSAQKSSHETAVALAQAPASRPVEVASETNATTVSLLDQAAGPLTAEEVTKIRVTIPRLLSENAEVRVQAEKQRARDLANISEISDALAKAEVKSLAADEKLREAFDRENALANQLRSQRAFLWILGGLAAVLGIGWVYVKIVLGGVPKAIGGALGELRLKNPDAAEILTKTFDTYLNRNEQNLIFKNSR